MRQPGAAFSASSVFSHCRSSLSCTQGAPAGVPGWSQPLQAAMFVSRVLADWCMGSAPLASASTRPEHTHAADEAPPADCLQAHRRYTSSGSWQHHSAAGSHVCVLALVHLQRAIGALASAQDQRKCLPHIHPVFREEVLGSSACPIAAHLPHKREQQPLHSANVSNRAMAA